MPSGAYLKQELEKTEQLRRRKKENSRITIMRQKLRQGLR